MRKALSLIAVFGLLASLASAAPTCFNSDARQQEVFTHAGRRQPPTKPYDDGGIIYIPPSRSRKNTDLDEMMWNLIRREMNTTYHEANYKASLIEKVCGEDEFGNYIAKCQLQILSNPVIRVIPTRAISKDIICSTETCTIGLQESVSVSTAHSTEVSVSITAGAKPFGIGMEFTTTLGYGFSSTAEESTALSYEFHLVKGNIGYIGMVNAEVSAQVHVSGCRCRDFICEIQCTAPTMSETGHHEAVILQNGIPRSFVSFIYTN